MKRLILLFIVTLVLLPAVAPAQEVVVSGFPEGVGISVQKDFFKPHYPALQLVADSLAKDPLAIGVITGSADGTRYSNDSDAKNPGLAVGRAHLLRNLLISEFKVNPDQLIVQSIDFTAKGPEYRYCSVRVMRTVAEVEKNLSTRIDSLAQRPPIEKHFTEIREVPAPAPPPVEPGFGLRFGAGFATSPFGGLPLLTGAISWKGVFYIEGEFGYTPWTGDYTFNNENLDTRRRTFGFLVIGYPWKNIPVGFTGGWLRTEQVSDKYYKYVRLAEGGVLGVRVDPLDFISVTGVWNPSKRRLALQDDAETKNGQFMLSVTAFIEFGGGR